MTTHIILTGGPWQLKTLYEIVSSLSASRMNPSVDKLLRHTIRRWVDSGKAVRRTESRAENIVTWLWTQTIDTSWLSQIIFHWAMLLRLKVDNQKNLFSNKPSLPDHYDKVSCTDQWIDMDNRVDFKKDVRWTHDTSAKNVTWLQTWTDNTSIKSWRIYQWSIPSTL